MDKETLSNYGWIVICVMVLAVMLAFASPFGNFVANAIKSTTQGLFDTNQNALDSAGIEIMQQEFEEMLNGPSATDSPVKFGQPYQMTVVENGMTLTMEYVFYADGSATMWMADAMAEYMPAGSFVYTQTTIDMAENSSPLNISADGTTLTDLNDETLKMTLKTVSSGKPMVGASYNADPNGLIGVTGIDIQIGADGSITIYENGIAGETIPASSIVWYDNYYTIDGEIAGAVYPDGSKVSLEGIVCRIACTHESTIAGQSKDATCTEAGYGDATVCINCGGVVSAGTVIPALGHSYAEEIIQEWSCTTAEIKKFTCSTCSHSYEETVEPYHTYEEGGYICTVCGYENTIDYTFYAYDFKNKTGIDMTSGNVVIPEVFQGNDGKWYRVTKLGPQAFYKYNDLISVTVPDSVTMFDCNAFYYCESLESVILGKDSQLTHIDYQVFDGCKSLKNIELPDGVTSIGYAAFRNSGITKITLPKGLASTGESVFYQCYSLTEVVIPNNITSIDYHAFAYCTSLTSVVVPDSVTSIGWGAFEHCENLKSIKLSKNITSIEKYTFDYCTNLTEIVIPDGVTSIGNWAFIGNVVTNGVQYPTNNLTSITLPASLTSIGESTFSGCTKLTTINFKGTIEQWNAISKDRNWNGRYYGASNSAIPATEVICSDGTVSLS